MAEEQNYYKQGEEKGYLKVEEKYVYYIQSDNHREIIKDPEEQVRAAFYVELIEKYKYSPERIRLEVVVPRRTPSDSADIVVFSDKELKNPYLVIECKRDGITDAEFKQAIEQAFGNANSLRAKFAAVIAGKTRTVFDVAGFQPEEREKNVIADIPKKYGLAPKYKYIKGDSERDIKPVDKDELIRTLDKCHDTVWQGGRLAPTTAFDEVSKLLFCKLMDEKEGTKLGKPYDFQVGTHESSFEVFSRIDNIYQQAKKKDAEVFKEDIRLEPEIVYTVVEHLQGISLSRTDLDTKGVAFEKFMEDFFRGKMGQFFTPRELINFTIQMLAPKHDDVVIDPACGSGGFLLNSMDFIKTNAEGDYSESEAKEIWHNFALKNLYGIEINDQIARVCKMNMIIHDDGHTNIISTDALRYFNEIEKIHSRFKPYSFDLLLTNPPFGASVKKTEKPYLPIYELGSKLKNREYQKTEILFIERCLHFLNAGGKMGIILPDGILTNASLQYVRDFIIENTKILAIISLPSFAFTHFGAGVKASILFLQKWREGDDLSKDYDIFLALADNIGYDATGRTDPKNDLFQVEEVEIERNGEIIKKTVVKRDEKILGAWNKFKEGERSNFAFETKTYYVKKSQLEGRLDPFYYHYSFLNLIKKLKSRYEIKELSELGVVFDGPFGSNLKNEEYVEKGIPLIRVQNIKNGQLALEKDSTVYITKEKHSELLRSEVTPGNVVITKTGWLGNAAIIPAGLQKANIRADLAGVRIKSKEILPEFLAIFINSPIGKKLCSRLNSGSTRERIVIQNMKRLPIPIPSLKEQKEIIEAVISQRAKAKSLLAKVKEVLTNAENKVEEKLLGS